MYNKNFATRNVRLRSPAGTRTCMSCGSKITKGSTYLGSTGIGYVNICLDCCKEAVFRSTGEFIVQSDPKKEKVLKQRIEELLKNYPAQRLIKEILVLARKNS